MKFVVRNRNEFINIADRLTFGDKPLQVTVKPFQRDRSNPQNAKVHAMIRELAVFTGYSESTMKDILRAELGPVQVVEIGGKILDAPKATSDYTVEEMAAFIEEIYRIGAEVGCVFQDG